MCCTRSPRSLTLSPTCIDSHGDSLHHCLVTIIVPDPEQLLPWAKANGVSGDLAELCQNQKVKDMILADIRKIGKEAKLKGFEIVRALHMEPEPWTADNGLLTPTFKLKRNIAKKHYAQQITDMYESIGAHVGGMTGLRQGE